jgi:hypothetical protein
MKPGSRQRRALGAVAVAAAIAATVTVSTASARGPASLSSPPNGVYTCAWIAAHPASAAQAQVTCDPSIFFAALSPLAALAAPASAESLATPASADSITADGCQPVPNGGGRVGQGVFAWSTYEYANQWTWVANYGPAYYTWYLQKTDGSTYAYGPISDTSAHSLGVAANIYRWGAQNHFETAQNWQVCYATV